MSRAALILAALLSWFTVAGCASAAPLAGGLDRPRVDPDLLDVDTIAARTSAAQEAAGTMSYEIVSEMDGEPVLELSGDMRVTDDIAMSMEMTDPSGTFEMVMLGPDIYVRSAGEQMWGYADAREQGEDLLGQPYEEFVASVSPQGYVESVADAIVAVEPRTSYEVFDKVRTRRYDLTLDPRELDAADLGVDPRRLPDRMGMSWWIDPDDLLRHAEIDLGPLAMEMDMDDFGEPVDIVAPPDRSTYLIDLTDDA